MAMQSIAFNTGATLEGGNVVNLAAGSQTVGGGGSVSTNCGMGGGQPCRNEVTDGFGTVAGGIGNKAGDYGAILGGISNTTEGKSAAAVGGEFNVASGLRSFVGGGFANIASAQDSVVAGGNINKAQGTYASVGGGQDNVASGNFSTVIGGSSNDATGVYSTASGVSACAGGDLSWAGGRFAKVRVGNEANDGNCASSSGDAGGDEGTFLWADNSSGADFVSTGPNQIAFRAVGGLRWLGTGENSTTSPAFTHKVNTASNTCQGVSSVVNSRTYLNHPLLNNNPSAVIVMTPNYGRSDTGNSPPPFPMAIYYNVSLTGGCPAGRWVIYQLPVSAVAPVSPVALNNNSNYNLWFVLP